MRNYFIAVTFMSAFSFADSSMAETIELVRLSGTTCVLRSSSIDLAIEFPHKAAECAQLAMEKEGVISTQLVLVNNSRVCNDGDPNKLSDFTVLTCGFIRR
jgi:hypothetical protein